MNNITNISPLSDNYIINEISSLQGQPLDTCLPPLEASNGEDGIRYIAVFLLENLIKETEKKELQNIKIPLIRRLSTSLNPEMLIRYNIAPNIQSFKHLMGFVTKYSKFIVNGAVLSIDILGRGTLEDLSSLVKFYLHFNENRTVDYEIVNDKGINKEETQKTIEDFLLEVENGEK